MLNITGLYFVAFFCFRQFVFVCFHLYSVVIIVPVVFVVSSHREKKKDT